MAAPKLDDALIAKIKGIQIRAKHLVNDVFAGEYRSAFKGRGMEFEEVREYQPGDDIRSIDWNVTARSNRPFIKLYRDERELTVIFVVDVSGSSRFGTHKKLKNEVAAEITALLAYSALRSNDKVGLLIFSDRVEHFLPPKKGKGHIWQIIKDILSYESTSRRTDFSIPLEFLNQVVKRRSIAFIVSDFQEDNYEKQLQTTARHHDLISIVVTDPKEIALPKIGYIEFEDAETGEPILIDTSKAALNSEFSKSAQKRFQAQKKFFHSAGIGYIPVDTSKAYIDPIVRYFREREKKR